MHRTFQTSKYSAADTTLEAIQASEHWPEESLIMSYPSGVKAHL